jgi:branched-chain amino acid transport system permease protein
LLSQLILQQTISGLAIGMTYALIAIGYTMVYGILKFINFGHGAVYMVGTYIAFFSWLSLIKIMPLWPSFILALLIAMILAAVFGILMEKAAYKPIRGKSRLTTFMSSLGVSLFVTYGMEFLVGSSPRPTPSLFEGVRFNLFGATITGMQIFMLVVAVFLVLGLQWFVKYTRLGKAIRACSEDPDAASLMGINLDTAISATFAIGSALGAVSGILIGIYYSSVYPTMGWSAGLKGFIAAVVGGIGSIPGAMIGGLILGLAENLGAGFLNSGYRDAIAFTVLVVVMLFRPMGIFRKEQRSSL